MLVGLPNNACNSNGGHRLIIYLRPVMFLRCVLEIDCPQIWSQVMSYINVHGVLQGITVNDSILASNTGATMGVTNGKGSYVPALAFAEGDALTGLFHHQLFVQRNESWSQPNQPVVPGFYQVHAFQR